jgi:predicted ATPase/DNA-binding SARP family transcriptional activator
MEATLSSASPLRLRLFGPFEACLNGAPLPRLRTRRGEWLLALLALRAGREVDRDWLAGTLWPESTETQALTNLRVSLADLRRALGEAAVYLSAPSPHSLALSLASADIDVVAFDAAIDRGDAASLNEAVALYRGPLLEGCAEAWVVEEREVREQASLAALERLAAEALAAGDPATAELHLRRAVAVDPLRETAQRALMEMLAAAGCYAAALTVYRELRLLLHRELSTEPDRETRALFGQIRTEARSKAVLGARCPVLGEVSEQPYEQRTAAVPAEHRAPSTEHRSAATPRHNLPLSLTRLIGRDVPIDEVNELLDRQRLVTLTGTGGCGKTRLAQAVARHWVETFPDGVWFVELAALADPALVPRAVAAVLGASEQPDRPLVDTLVDALKPHALLLVLDNCEHLIDACARLAQTLLQAAPGVRLLATSREPLGIPGEASYRVPSLPLSASCLLFAERAADVMPTFRLTEGNTPAIEEICRRLDGIPLAIELAAARVKTLPVKKIAARLDDRFCLLTRGSRTALPRHQTLQALIDWSYDLLSEEERCLLRRLSVFAGGWTLAAAEAVCGDAEVLDWLTGLVDKSLVRYDDRGDEERYGLLETVRQYARDRLQQSGEAALVRERHRDYFLALAERAGPEMIGREQAAWLEQLDREHNNLRAALDGSLESGEVEAGVRSCGSVWRFWHNRGYIAEGRGRLAAFLSHTSASKETRARAKALDGAGSLAIAARDWEAARAYYQELLAIGHALGDEQIIATALTGAGHVALFESDNALARSPLEQGLGLARKAGALWEVAFTLHLLGYLAARQRDAPGAWPFYQEALAIRRELGDKGGISNTLAMMAALAKREGDYEMAKVLWGETLANSRGLGAQVGVAPLFFLGELAQLQGDHAAARSYFQEILAIAGELPRQRYGWGIADGFYGLGRVALDQGEFETARTLFAKSLAIWRDVGDECAGDALQGLGDVARLQGDLAAACRLYEEALTCCRPDRRAGLLLGLGIAAQKQGNTQRAAALCRESLALCQEVGEKADIPSHLEAFGNVAGAQGQFRQAVRLLSVAAAIREAIGTPLPPSDRPEYQRDIAAAREALGEGAFAAAWVEGQALSLEEAVSDALRTDAEE